MYIIRNLLRYIINFEEIVYHQTAGKYTLMSDDIQPKGLMIYTLKRDDIPLLSQWINKKGGLSAIRRSDTTNDAVCRRLRTADIDPAFCGVFIVVLIWCLFLLLRSG